MSHKLILKRYEYKPVYVSDPEEWSMDIETIETTYLENEYSTFFEAVSIGEDILKKITGKGMKYFDGEHEMISEVRDTYFDTDETDSEKLIKLFKEGAIRKSMIEFHIEIEEVA